MKTIDGHTFDETKLSGGWVIDAGCRFWRMTDWMMLGGHSVFALDIQDFRNDCDFPDGCTFKHAALTAKPGIVDGHYFGDGTGNFIKGLNGIPYNGPDRPCQTISIQSITLWDIYNEIGTDIDLLKLDIEGSEYEILASLWPIPRQVTVEFHEHCHTELHNRWIDRVVEHMSKEYVLTQFPVPGAERYKFMDCLFTRKDLL